MALRFFSRGKRRKEAAASRKGASTAPSVIPRHEYQPAPRVEPSADPLRRLLQQGRPAVILQNAAHWGDRPGAEGAKKAALKEIQARLADVPASAVSISETISEQAGGPEADYQDEPFLLSIHAVTNADFQHFVDGGGYGDQRYWPASILPHLIELIDLSGKEGPRFWRDGRHDWRFADHPVVGVSWYEAQAYALWCGLRLPTESEWQAVASWSIQTEADILRRFPWGDAMDLARCNVWSSQRGGTVPVQEYEKGQAPNGVRQLIGNTWEWTASPMLLKDDMDREIIGEMPMQVIRGGAFDTYFEAQATAQFSTGLIALARHHNTGFRTALTPETICPKVEAEDATEESATGASQ